MEYSYFDIVISIIILLLGLKGILNGFFKELFGLLGIIGGIFIASRLGEEVGQYLSDTIFKFENTSAISFTGFLITLLVFWLFMIMIGFVFKKLSKMSGLGILDKIFGFVFAAGKFFLIVAVIAYATYNVKAVKSSIDAHLNNSILFPILVKTGGFIMKIDPTQVSQTINETIDESEKSIKKQINDSTTKIVNDTKEQIIKSMPDMAKDIKPDEKEK